MCMKVKFLFIEILFILLNTCLYSQVTVSLKNAIMLARKNNSFYNAEKLNTDIAKTGITTAAIRSNPSVSVSMQQIPYSKYFTGNTSFFDPENRQVTYQMSKTIQINGQRNYKIKQAEAELSLSQASLADYERNLLSDVTQQWLNVWYASEKLNIIKRARLNAYSLLKINQIRLKDQVITSTEYTRTEIIDEQYTVMLSNARQTLSSENKSLTLLLGINDSIQIDDNQMLLMVAIPDKLDSIINFALNNRTDILASKKTVDKTQNEILLQKAYAFPQPEIGFSYGSQNKITYLGAYLAIPLPIFDRNQGEIAKAEISLHQAKNYVDAYTLKVKSEVQNTYKEFLNNRMTFQKFDELYMKSQNVLNTVKISYLKGGTTILDYLEAERSWFEMQNQYIEALYNYRKSYLQILVASNLILNL
jgi:outer membrane protein, heavy metal efflux system